VPFKGELIRISIAAIVQLLQPNVYDDIDKYLLQSRSKQCVLCLSTISTNRLIYCAYFEEQKEIGELEKDFCIVQHPDQIDRFIRGTGFSPF
jgi:hypothetical protein